MILTSISGADLLSRCTRHDALKPLHISRLYIRSFGRFLLTRHPQRRRCCCSTCCSYSHYIRTSLHAFNTARPADSPAARIMRMVRVIQLLKVGILLLNLIRLLR